MTAARLYPGQNQLNSAYVPAAKTTIGTTPSATTVGIKNNPTLTTTQNALKAAPWQLLKFQVNKPYYYQYLYISTGTQGSGNSTFNAGAQASLSETVDSKYYIAGQSDGKAGNILECDESTNGSLLTDAVVCPAGT